VSWIIFFSGARRLKITTPGTCNSMKHGPVTSVGWIVSLARSVLPCFGVGWSLDVEDSVQTIILLVFSLNCLFIRAYTKGLTAELNITIVLAVAIVTTSMLSDATFLNK